MIKDKHKLEEFERKLLETENLPYKQALTIYDDLFKEAVSLGVINTDNILEGIEVDIKLARILNQLK
jgi:hypothetical protein